MAYLSAVFPVLPLNGAIALRYFGALLHQNGLLRRC